MVFGENSSLCPFMVSFHSITSLSFTSYLTINKNKVWCSFFLEIILIALRAVEWLEHPTVVRKPKGSTFIGGLDFSGLANAPGSPNTRKFSYCITELNCFFCFVFHFSLFHNVFFPYSPRNLADDSGA